MTYTKTQQEILNKWYAEYGHKTITSAVPNPKRLGSVAHHIYRYCYRSLPATIVDIMGEPFDDFELERKYQAHIQWDIEHGFVTVGE